MMEVPSKKLKLSSPVVDLPGLCDDDDISDAWTDSDDSNSSGLLDSTSSGQLDSTSSGQMDSTSSGLSDSTSSGQSDSTSSGEVAVSVPCWASLPVELKLKVLDYLSQKDKLSILPFVCKEWRKLASDCTLWKVVKLDGTEMSAHVAVVMVSGMPMLRRLEMSKWTAGADQVLIAVAKTCSQLEVLELGSITTLYQRTLDMIARHCSNLKSLKMEIQLLPRTCRHPLDIFSVCSKLRTISLHLESQVRPVTPSSLQSCTSLKEVTLQYLTDEDRRTYCMGDFGQPRRVHLLGWGQYQEYTRLLVRCNKANDLRLLTGINAAPTLDCLAMRWMIRLTVDSFIKFITGEPIARRLERLDLMGARNLESRCVKAIADHCPSLLYLDLSCTRASRDSIFTLVTACKRLLELRLFSVIGLFLTQVDQERLTGMRPNLILMYEREAPAW